MKKNMLIIPLLLACGLRAEPELPPSYLSHEEIEQAVVALGTLEYPLTQGEVLKKLHAEGRHLPGMVISDRELTHPGPEFFQIHLTDPEARAKSYDLYLWFDANPQRLSGQAFVDARNIEYAEILFRDGNARYIAQSRRYPYKRLDYENRKIRKD